MQVLPDQHAHGMDSNAPVLAKAVHLFMCFGLRCASIHDAVDHNMFDDQIHLHSYQFACNVPGRRHVRAT